MQWQTSALGMRLRRKNMQVTPANKKQTHYNEMRRKKNEYYIYDIMSTVINLEKDSIIYVILFTS